MRKDSPERTGVPSTLIAATTTTGSVVKSCTRAASPPGPRSPTGRPLVMSKDEKVINLRSLSQVPRRETFVVHATNTAPAHLRYGPKIYQQMTTDHDVDFGLGDS